MTLRTYVHYSCPQGHRGEEKTSENDQPYSDNWETVTIKGMIEKPVETGVDYFCEICGERMSIVQSA